MMQPPPQQYSQYQQPPKNGPNILLIVLGVIAVVGCLGTIVLAAILFPVFQSAKQAAKKTMAVSNLKRVSTGLIMYTGDWDDLLQPYTKPEDILISPVAREKDPTAYGFAFRKGLSLKNTAKMQDHDIWVMVFDSTDVSRNANSDLETLPDPGRYGNGDRATNTIGFLDTHVKAMTPAQMKAGGADGRPIAK
jgi:hypothetical protein